MEAVRNTAFTLTVGLGLMGLFLFHYATHYHDPYPPMTASLKTSETDLRDVGGVAMGFRRFTADIAWVQTLQYYGTHEHDEHGHSESEFESGHNDHYPRFLVLCQRVSGIDPYFTYVYYYGAGVLGWNLNRLSEAEELLKEGITRNPNEWRLTQYLAGLSYHKNHDVAGVTRFLEVIADDPQCPLLMKALLANLYTKNRFYDKALQMWEKIYASGDPKYVNRAIEETQEILQLRQKQGLDKNPPAVLE